MSGDDVICNSSSNPHIREVLERRLTRRDLLRGGLSATALSFAGGGSALLSACATTEAGYACSDQQDRQRWASRRCRRARQTQ